MLVIVFKKWLFTKNYLLLTKKVSFFCFEDSIFLLMKSCIAERLNGSSNHHIYDLFRVISFELILCTKTHYWSWWIECEKSSHGWKPQRKDTRSFRISYYIILSITFVCKPRHVIQFLTPVLDNMYLQIVQCFQRSMLIARFWVEKISPRNWK